MRIDFDVYAVQLTEENIPLILEATKPLGWTLDCETNNLQYNREDYGWETVLYMKLFKGTTDIATFASEPIVPERDTISFLDETDPKFGLFHKFVIS